LSDGRDKSGATHHSRDLVDLVVQRLVRRGSPDGERCAILEIASVESQWRGIEEKSLLPCARLLGAALHCAVTSFSAPKHPAEPLTPRAVPTGKEMGEEGGGGEVEFQLCARCMWAGPTESRRPPQVICLDVHADERPEDKPGQHQAGGGCPRFLHGLPLR
jgi:hypothetical protein